jgi:hypothetical protein
MQIATNQGGGVGGQRVCYVIVRAIGRTMMTYEAISLRRHCPDQVSWDRRRASLPFGLSGQASCG